MAKAAKPKVGAAMAAKPKAPRSKAIKLKAASAKSLKAKPRRPELDEAGIVDTLYGLTLAVLGIAEFVADRDPGLADHLEEMLTRRSSLTGPQLNFPRSVIAELRNRPKPIRRATRD